MTFKFLTIFFVQKRWLNHLPRFLIMKPGKDFKARNPHVSLAKMAHGMSSKMSVSFTRLHHVLLNHNSGRGEQDPSSKY